MGIDHKDFMYGASREPAQLVDTAMGRKAVCREQIMGDHAEPPEAFELEADEPKDDIDLFDEAA